MTVTDALTEKKEGREGSLARRGPYSSQATRKVVEKLLTIK